jgi:hypothetical protein
MQAIILGKLVDGGRSIFMMPVLIVHTCEIVAFRTQRVLKIRLSRLFHESHSLTYRTLVRSVLCLCVAFLLFHEPASQTVFLDVQLLKTT